MDAVLCRHVPHSAYFAQYSPLGLAEEVAQGDGCALELLLFAREGLCKAVCLGKEISLESSKHKRAF